MTLQALPLAAGTAFEVQGTIGTSTRLAQGTGAIRSLEFTSLRTINVENFGNSEEASGPTFARWICANPLMPAWARPTRPGATGSAQHRPQHRLQTA